MPQAVQQDRKPTFSYTRVSTRDQSIEGQSLVVQTARIRNYASDRGLVLGGIYEDIASAAPGKPARPDFLRAINDARTQVGVLIVTDIDRLSRPYQEVKQQVIDAGIPVHVVSLNRLTGRKNLPRLAKLAEAGAVRISHDTRTALAGKSARGAKLGATAKTLRKATAISLRNRSALAWKTVIDIAIFMTADPDRLSLSCASLVAALNAASIKSTRGKQWTKDTLYRPLRKARQHIALQDEPDGGPAGFSDVRLL